MLRIKKEINLKELEKFGFKCSDNCCYHECGLEICLGDYYFVKKLEIEFAYETDNFSFEKCLNTLYNLITAGYVEKVEA